MRVLIRTVSYNSKWPSQYAADVDKSFDHIYEPLTLRNIRGSFEIFSITSIVYWRPVRTGQWLLLLTVSYMTQKFWDVNSSRIEQKSWQCLKLKYCKMSEITQHTNFLVTCRRIYMSIVGWCEAQLNCLILSKTVKYYLHWIWFAMHGN